MLMQKNLNRPWRHQTFKNDLILKKIGFGIIIASSAQHQLLQNFVKHQPACQIS